MPLRLVFMGTPDFAVPTLQEILRAGHQVVAVYARAPKLGGRGLDLLPSPVERQARRFGLQVLTPMTLRSEEAEVRMRAHRAEVAVIVAYGLILPQPILDAFQLGAFNLHASLLPRWRGAAPINRAIMAGDTETGVMVMKMEAGLDTGPIVAEAWVRIEPDATAGDLHDVLAHVGADLMVNVLADIERGSLMPPEAQPETGITYAKKIDKNESRIRWDRSWREVHNQIRSLSPFPGAWCEIAGKGIRIKVLRTTKGEGAGAPGTVLDDQLTVACGEGAVRILELQRADRRPMKAHDFLRGTPIAAGARLC